MHRMEVARTVDELRLHADAWRDLGHVIGLVPTMGALHAGHMALIEALRKEADVVIASIFVNPLQFGPGEDYDRYPRREEDDLEKLREAGVDLAWLPTPEEMYPHGFATTLKVAGPATAGLEDAHRPGHFDGVATVVAKLFCQSGCHVAAFGEKDYQQLQVIRRMARDLDMPVRIIAVPTVREKDGLAMSSRNAYLDVGERALAPRLFNELQGAAQRIRAGTSVEAATFDGARALEEAGFVVDYFTARHAETLQPVKDQAGEPMRLLAAARLSLERGGEVRLIDNIAV